MPFVGFSVILLKKRAISFYVPYDKRRDTPPTAAASLTPPLEGLSRSATLSQAQCRATGNAQWIIMLID